MTTQYRPHHLAPTFNTARVWLVCRDFSGTASHVGLYITADYTAKALGQRGVWAEALAVKSAVDLEAKLAATKTTAVARNEVRPSHVVISAPWIAATDIDHLAAAHPEIRFYVISHSNVGFLQADPQAIAILKQIVDLQMSSHNIFAGGNCETFCEWASDAWRVPMVWAPNLYSTSEIFAYKDRFWTPGTPLRIGIFGANRPLKNQLTAAAAAVELAVRYGTPVNLILSSGRNEGAGDAAMNELVAGVPNLTLTRTGWLPWPKFRQLVRSVHVVLQMSYSESFNVVTADAIAEGVPVVTGSAIEWVPKHWMADPDDAIDVARVADTLLRDRTSPHEGRQALYKYIEWGWVGWQRLLLH